MHNKKNILICTHILDHGGAESITYNIIQKLSKKQYNIIICTLYESGVIGSRLLNQGYPIYSNLMRNKFDVRVLYKLSKICFHHKIHILYIITQPLTLFWCYLIAKICKLPIISVIHNTVSLSDAHKFKIYKIFLPLVTKIVTVARMQMHQLVQNQKLPDSKMSVIYNGVDIEQFNSSVNVIKTKQSLGLNPKNKTVGMVTRFYPLKGIDIFLEAAAKINRIYPSVQFLIIGNGPQMPAMIDLSEELDISHKVHFLGFRENINELIPLFDIAVISSRTEALPLVVLEYMSCGKVVVATRVGSVPELVVHGKTGFLVDPENSTELANKILLLLHNPYLASIMGCHGKYIVSEKFTLEKTVEQTEALFNECISL
jgi:glycosyltransferase involved in cell wall biosynthesis